MAASASDKFRKGAAAFSTTLASQKASSAGSCSLSDATGIPTTTGIDITVGRVDSSGTRTPSKKAVYKGTLSGTTVSNLTLVEGTDQLHAAGTPVEITYTAANHNDMIDGFLQDHVNPNGNHKTLTDSNGAEWIEQGSVASAVNQLKASNSATTKPVILETNGDDSDPSMIIRAKGTGVVIIKAPLPVGGMINGQILPSVSSNNLTLALKTLVGNDPSADDPVYVRIGNTLRVITSALSVTKNAGTNWFGAGGAMFATQEIDYFAYMGYNTTDGVTIGFARIPYARTYGEFSTTTTEDKYCAISTTTNAASTDEYQVVGRFAAILGATASFNWSVPTFTAAGLVNRPIYETRELIFAPVLSGRFTDAKWDKTCKYTIRGGDIEFTGFLKANTTTPMAGGSAEAIFTLPFTSRSITSSSGLDPVGTATLLDAGTSVVSGDVEIASTTTGRIRYFAVVSSLVVPSPPTSTAPFTFTTSDEFSFLGKYKLA